MFGMWKEGGIMNTSKVTKIVFSCFLLLFYFAIVMYVFLAVMRVDVLQNFIAGMVFESIGFLLLVIFILKNIFTQTMKVGYFVPMLIVMIAYIILLNILNMLAIEVLPSVVFILLNLVLLFVYCVITIPMYIMGKNKTN